jgi:hypothetical protein
VDLSNADRGQCCETFLSFFLTLMQNKLECLSLASNFLRSILIIAMKACFIVIS